ncbi:hypothetical protein PMAYCL1PPCAC_28009, partial [Pristionchus mayeri]
ALFIQTFIRENEPPFLMVQSTLFAISSCISIMVVSERAFAVWKAAEYEKSGRHTIPLVFLIGCSLFFGLLHLYALFWHNLMYETIGALYLMEGTTLIISVVIIVYARHKIR